MIQTRNQYLQFMLVMLAAWGISWGARFVMEQAVLFMDQEKLFVLQSWYCSDVPAVCFPGIPPLDSPLPVVGQLRNVGVRGWSVRWPWCMSVYFCSVRRWLLPAEPFMTKLFADKSIPDGSLTLLTIFILAPLNEGNAVPGGLC